MAEMKRLDAPAAGPARRTWDAGRPRRALAGLALLATLAGCATSVGPASSASPVAPTGPTTAATSPASTASGAKPTASGTKASASSSAKPAVQGPADAEGSGAIATLASANLGKPAGTCAVKPEKNSLGGAAFEHSCSGWNKEPEYWCADFVIWTWRNSGYDVSGLDAGAISFRRYGVKHASMRPTPKPGDAIVFNKTMSTTTAAHVAVVLRVNDDGSVVVANGDWAGQKGSQVRFATTSSVVETTLPASQAVVGGGPIAVQGGIQVIAIVAPVRQG